MSVFLPKLKNSLNHINFIVFYMIYNRQFVSFFLPVPTDEAFYKNTI